MELSPAQGRKVRTGPLIIANPMSHPNDHILVITMILTVPKRWELWEALLYYTVLPFSPIKKISTITLFILIMPCHTWVWHVCHPYCCNMANFLEGSFLKLLWLVFHIPLFPWWFVWPHQRLATNAYFFSWEVTFSLFKPAMCWPFVIWNLVCLRNRHKHPSILSTGRAICIFILQLIVCLRFHFDSLFLFLPPKEDSAKKYLSSFPSLFVNGLQDFWNTFFPCFSLLIFILFHLANSFFFFFSPIKKSWNWQHKACFVKKKEKE